MATREGADAYPALSSADEASVFLQVPDLIRAGDPRLSLLGPSNETDRLFEPFAREATRSVWNQQFTMFLSATRVSRHLDEVTTRPGLDRRLILPERAIDDMPLISSRYPELRLGSVVAPAIIVDRRLLFVGGPPEPGLESTVWLTEDPLLVRLACEEYEASWAASRSPEEAGYPPPLPRRTFEVAMLLADGATDREIALELGVSPRTASAEVQGVVTALGARSRTHAVARLVGATR